jgi:hypothetical protein
MRRALRASFSAAARIVGQTFPPSNVSTRGRIERRFPSVRARTFEPSEVAKKIPRKVPAVHLRFWCAGPITAGHSLHRWREGVKCASGVRGDSSQTDPL